MPSAEHEWQVTSAQGQAEKYLAKLIAEGREPSDRARRATEIINGYIAFMKPEDLAGHYVAIRLSDGGSDGVLYERKQDAVRHQLHESQCAYIGLRNFKYSSAKPLEMDIILDMHEKVYDANRKYSGVIRLADPDRSDGGPDLIYTANERDAYRARGWG